MDVKRGFSTWSSAKRLRIFAHASRDEVILELPEIKICFEAMATNPWAVVLFLLFGDSF